MYSNRDRLFAELPNEGCGSFDTGLSRDARGEGGYIGARVPDAHGGLTRNPMRLRLKLWNSRSASSRRSRSSSTCRWVQAQSIMAPGVGGRGAGRPPARREAFLK